MSFPPKYQRHPNAAPEDEESLLPALNRDTKGERLPDEEANIGLNAVGPAQAISGASDRPNVRYTFTPRWPVAGESEDALGVLGRNRDETTTMLQTIFPTLAKYSAERIEYLIPVSIDSNGRVVDDRWGLVMDDAWKRFDRDPPGRLKVQVKDGPRDAARRMRRQKIKLCLLITVAVTSPIWLLGCIGAIAVMLGDS